MTQRDIQKKRTRVRIIRAALRLFGKKGILGTKTMEVAKAARVSHGLIFAHFPTRDDLVSAVIGTFGERATRRIHDLVRSDASLREVLESHLNSVSEHEAFYTRLVIEGPLLPPLARCTLIGIQSAISLHLYGAAEREMKAGTIRPVPIPLLFNTWLGLVHHYLINSDLFAPGNSVVARHGRALVDHYMNLLTP